MGRSIDERFDFFIRQYGELIQLNDEIQLAIVKDASDSPNPRDDKIIRTKASIQTGDLIDYRDERYLIISQIDRNNLSNRSRMRKCNYSIAFNWSGNIKWFDAVIDGDTFSVEEGRIMSLPIGKINVYLQDSSDAKDIKLDQRFFNSNQPFIVEGLDRTNKGVVKLNCKLDSFNPAYDDVENNIVDRWKYETNHMYTLSITNGTSANVMLNDTIQLICVATDNDDLIDIPTITYSSSHPNVVSVDNQGKVMGIEVGQAIITASMTYHPTISNTIQITVVEEMSHNYSILLSGEVAIKLGQSKSYVAAIYDNGSEVIDQSIQWILKNQDNSTPVKGSITANTGNSSTIKAGSQYEYMNNYIVLTAALTSDANITAEKIIQIRSLF
jgi:hypothetical protein